jgi:AcrR family transcriptional regulator
VGTFYHYFEKKSDLLVGLLGLVDQYLEENVAASLTREEEGENLTLLALGFARHVREKGPERSRLINGIPLSDVDLSGSPRLLNTLSRQIIERGQEKGQFRTDRSAEELTRLYLITIRGVAADWSRRSMAYDILEVMEEEMALFVRGIAP